MKKSKTLLVLALMVCLCVLLASCDGSVSSKDDNGNDAPDMVYVPQFQLVSASKAIDFAKLGEYYGDGMDANNAVVFSMQLPSLVGFTEKTSSDALLEYTQTILGKDVSIACTKADDGSYIFEGTTTDDSIYIRTVVKPDNSVDYLEMKKFSFTKSDGTSDKMIAVTNGTVAIDPSKEYQTGTATVYVADNENSNFTCPLQFYISGKVAASVMDFPNCHPCSAISQFGHYFENEMDYDSAQDFIKDASSASTQGPLGGHLNLTFHLVESNIYEQNVYIDEDGKCFLPGAGKGGNRYATDWDDMQKYVSFLTDGNWTLEH